jgi:hypothetical protein
MLSVFMCEHWQYWPKAMGTSRAALSLRPVSCSRGLMRSGEVAVGTMLMICNIDDGPGEQRARPMSKGAC